MERITAAVPEEVVRLDVNGLHIATWTASPHALDALGAGRLVALGLVATRKDVLALRVHRDHAVHRIAAEVRPERMAAALQERDHRAEHGCGLRFLLDCRPDLVSTPPDRVGADSQTLAGRERAGGRLAPTAPPSLDAFPDLLRELFDRSPSRQTTGGHHTAALSDGTRLIHLHEVIGRHNGADKAIGGALLAGDDLSGLGLITTARISGEIAEKAARAGLAWIASRSVPTTLAVEIAAAARIPVVARAGGRDVRVFSGRAD